MDSPSIIYTPRPDATPEAELNALANVYKLVIDSARNRSRLPDSVPNTKREKHGGGGHVDDSSTHQSEVIH